MNWSADHIDQLQHMVDDMRMTAREIATRLGVSRNAVIGAADRYDIRWNWSETELRFMRRQGGRKRAAQMRRERRKVKISVDSRQ